MNILFTNHAPINYEGLYAYADKSGYHFVAVERGITNMHKITKNLFEISYWIYSYLTFIMALKYEHHNRRKNQDPRRLHFEKQLELLELIGENYRDKREKEINAVVKIAPYDDNVL